MNRRLWAVMLSVIVVAFTAFGACAAATDVVVVGSGAAGLAAALEARQNGAEVIILEKMPFTGGTTRVAGGGLCAAGVDLQLKYGITEDSPEVHAADMLKLGQYRNDPELVRTVAYNAKHAVDWIRANGLELEDEVVSYMSTHPRIYWCKGRGFGLAEGLAKACREAGVTVELETRAVKLVKEDNAIVGVVAKKANGDEVVYEAKKGVVLATGGFGENQDLFKEYAPELTGIRTNNPQGVSTGDGVLMGRAIGAKLVDMELGRIVPMGVAIGQGAWTSAPAGLLAEGGVMVNKKGQPFLKDEQDRDLAVAILAQPDHTGYLVFDGAVLQKVGEGSLDRIKGGGALVEGSLEAVAAKFGVDAGALQGTANKADLKAPYYAIAIEPYIHSTTGGLAINTLAQVLDEKDDVIPGLFAAGEVTGGIQGADQKNALIDCLVFGRIAGRNAAQGH
ncbi:MAG: FAD-dependent oxidoreductase [Firmicutes bacterium]|nr:FAD-dependent oxidoreductase [Bacillota bacterium]